ncbi:MULTISPECIES: hypothetical protein [Vibrio]|uniref:hypothetical protein n=1 Tax=Vibrio TaxID=662 RepID=UPI0004D989BD|nr:MULTISPECIES: hypothetical protein [Vibrio]OQU02253.1 hypothetical protein EM85_001510 [Vibrio parahaemolyticus]EGQ9113242.1 hypothetical protein [Vibrio alginolyticus]EGR1564814.1 hypothetical protein [Vibrio alginolyticus]EHA1100997.1 hypothetical protein [Vibrio alginolyticus]EHA1123179.1 hypothetical protein [Vibrio alginolyticus]
MRKILTLLSLIAFGYGAFQAYETHELNFWLSGVVIAYLLNRNNDSDSDEGPWPKDKEYR